MTEKVLNINKNLIYKKFVKIILPLKLEGLFTYAVPRNMEDKLTKGKQVQVKLVNKNYIGIISEILDQTDIDPRKLKPILSYPDLPNISEMTLKFWLTISDYYMCQIGEVFTASQKYYDSKLKLVNTEETKINYTAPKLSNIQVKAYENIQEFNKKSKITLLKGVTGSGKTEIYIRLIIDCLYSGKNALYLLPEIAVSKPLSKRLSKVFGDDLLIFHSKQTPANKRKIIEILSNDNTDNIDGKSKNSSNRPKVILGLRSALFLPFQNLGLIIVDEEHDKSYKQDSPAPRYNGRDAAIILGTIYKSKILLGSATPSFETLNNVNSGKYCMTELSTKYYDAPEPEIEIVDMKSEKHKWAIKKSFSLKLINDIQDRLEKKEGVLIFRSRRSYSPAVQCSICGEIVKCPNCNIPLSYHRYDHSLRCHYCDYHSTYRCTNCGSEELQTLGSGTEKIEEELSELFPDANIARYDADTTKKKSDADKILSDFASGKTDILVGTQMISKGFDFEKLSLAAIINADSVLSLPDFRADEKALTLFTQLLGRVGRRKTMGKLLIQTFQPEHPVFHALISNDSSDLMTERRIFKYPPYARHLNIMIKETYSDKANRIGKSITSNLYQAGIKTFIGPYAPTIEMIQKKHIRIICVSLPKTQAAKIIKQKIKKILIDYKNVYCDVDPQ
ncbi:MAG: primosomal protein N' [Bacteroidales bacterium]